MKSTRHPSGALETNDDIQRKLIELCQRVIDDGCSDASLKALFESICDCRLPGYSVLNTGVVSQLSNYKPPGPKYTIVIPEPVVMPYGTEEAIKKGLRKEVIANDRGHGATFKGGPNSDCGIKLAGGK